MLRPLLAILLIIAAGTAAAAEESDEGTPTAVSDFPDAPRARVMTLVGDHVVLDARVAVVKGENIYIALIMARGGDTYTNLELTVDGKGKELKRRLVRDPDAPKLLTVERRDGKRFESYEGGQTVEASEDAIDVALAKEAEAKAAEAQAAEAKAAQGKATEAKATERKADTAKDPAKP